jgi:hypothetical protein
MANVIDTFVVEFSLDPSKFTAGQREARRSGGGGEGAGAAHCGHCPDAGEETGHAGERAHGRETAAAGAALRRPRLRDLNPADASGTGRQLSPAADIASDRLW